MTPAKKENKGSDIELPSITKFNTPDSAMKLVEDEGKHSINIIPEGEKDSPKLGREVDEAKEKHDCSECEPCEDSEAE